MSSLDERTLLLTTILKIILKHSKSWFRKNTILPIFSFSLPSTESPHRGTFSQFLLTFFFYIYIRKHPVFPLNRFTSNIFSWVTDLVFFRIGSSTFLDYSVFTHVYFQCQVQKWDGILSFRLMFSQCGGEREKTDERSVKKQVKDLAQGLQSLLGYFFSLSEVTVLCSNIKILKN